MQRIRRFYQVQGPRSFYSSIPSKAASNYGKNDTHTPKTDYNMHFFYSQQFEMMMQRRHFKDPPFKKFIGHYLQNYRQSFDHKYPANNYQQELLMQDYCDPGQGRSNRKGTNVPHKSFRVRKIKIKK